MSLDPEWSLVVPALLGQAGLFVVAINMVHGAGFTKRWLDWLNPIVLCGSLALAAVVVGHASTAPWTSWPWWVRADLLACLVTVAVGLPLTNLLRLARRQPSEVAGSVAEVDLAASNGRAALIGTGKHSWMLHLPGNESFRLEKREWQVTLPNLPPRWDGFSIVHLSDLHFATCYRRAYFEAIADEAAAWDADLVAFTGDLIDDDAALDWIVPVLSRLRGRLATCAILGNHDCEHQPRKIRRAVKDAGFADLDGRWTGLEIEGATLAIGGTSFPWGPSLDLRERPAADFRLLLSHSPDRFAWAAQEGIDLVLSGHNHAGQIRLPLVGPVFMPSVYSRRYDRGFFRSGRTLMYVSQGVAGKHPIRYGGCSPELTRLVLRAASPVGPPPDEHRPGRVDVTADALGSGVWG